VLEARGKKPEPDRLHKRFDANRPTSIHVQSHKRRDGVKTLEYPTLPLQQADLDDPHTAAWGSLSVGETCL
jgi:hypothetical protein